MNTTEEILTWASNADGQLRTIVAARSVLRMLPLVVDGAAHAKLQWTQEEISLSVLRATITALCSAYAIEQKGTLRENAGLIAARFFEGETAANLEKSQPERDWMHAAHAAHFLAQLCQSETTDAFEKAAKETFWSADWVGDIHEQGPEAYRLAEAEVLRDIWSLQDGDGNSLWRRPLWSNEYRESRLRFPDWRIDLPLNGSSVSGDYWRRWHKGFCDGQPLDWDLQRRIALEVTDEDWAEGPATVARRIREIEAKHKVERALVEAKPDSDVVANNRFGIGGNSPPPEEAIDISEVGEAAIELEQSLAAVRTEVDSSSPSKSNLQIAAATLQRCSAAIFKWVASKLDLAIDENIKQGTKWLWRGGFGYILINADKVKALIDAVIDWVKLL